MEAICLTAGKSGERIDKFLSEELDSLSRSYIQKLVKDGEVRVNGNAVKANYKVNINDSIEVNIPEPEERWMSCMRTMMF